MPDRNDPDAHSKTAGNTVPQLPPETILNSRYVIVQRLHEGGTGSVYLARDRLLASTVAIKELVVDPEQRESTIVRFSRYATQLSRLSHPSIPKVYDSFYAEELGRFYVVRQHVTGTSLVSLTRGDASDPFTERSVTELALQVADVLDYLHRQEPPITCKNLKPANLVVTQSRDRVMLMHWFDSWSDGEKEGAELRNNSVIDPLELSISRLKARSDVYRLGATMFQLLTRVDLQKDQVFDFATSPKPRELNGQISTEMEQILMRALESRPEDRFSARELTFTLVNHLKRLKERETNYRNAARLEEFVPEEKHADETGDSPMCLDENVQFTVYRPSKIKPLRWYPLLAYAHLTEPRDDEDGADPIARVEQEAERVMRDANVKDVRHASEDSVVAIPRQGEISFVPFISGVDFNPPRASFFWEESVHRQDFRMRASASLEGKTARGRMSVFLGAILIAEINLSVQVSSSGSNEIQPKREQPVRPYRRIFSSYSHKDREIVAQIEHYAQTTGDKYMRDVFELRSGQNWKKWMAEAIDGADIFQLFWSTNSMRSENVRLEWEYALRLEREEFVRPTYWETPLPSSPSENLPPPELKDLFFRHVRPLGRRAVIAGQSRRSVSDYEPAPATECEKSYKPGPLARGKVKEELPKRNEELIKSLEETRLRWAAEEEESRRAEEQARRLAEKEARPRAEEERRRLEQMASELESIRDRLTRDEAGARLSREVVKSGRISLPQAPQRYPPMTESMGRDNVTLSYGGPEPKSSSRSWGIVAVILVLGLLLTLLVGFLIWRNT